MSASGDSSSAITWRMTLLKLRSPNSQTVACLKANTCSVTSEHMITCSAARQGLARITIWCMCATMSNAGSRWPMAQCSSTPCCVLDQSSPFTAASLPSQDATFQRANFTARTWVRNSLLTYRSPQDHMMNTKRWLCDMKPHIPYSCSLPAPLVSINPDITPSSLMCRPEQLRRRQGGTDTNCTSITSRHL